jgi:hypothetical protein
MGRNQRAGRLVNRAGLGSRPPMVWIDGHWMADTTSEPWESEADAGHWSADEADV